jgi:hypothetical protein
MRPHHAMLILLGVAVAATILYLWAKERTGTSTPLSQTITGCTSTTAAWTCCNGNST